MSGLVRYRPEAADDIAEAYDWYEAERPGLGDKFRAAVVAAEELLALSPTAFPVVYRRLRRLLLRRFPYSVYFTIEETGVVIWACIHQARHQRVWRARGGAG